MATSFSVSRTGPASIAWYLYNPETNHTYSLSYQSSTQGVLTRTIKATSTSTHWASITACSSDAFSGSCYDTDMGEYIGGYSVEAYEDPTSYYYYTLNLWRNFSPYDEQYNIYLSTSSTSSGTVTTNLNTTLSKSVWSREDYVFKGYATSESGTVYYEYDPSTYGTTTPFNPEKSSITVYADTPINLYGVWEEGGKTLTFDGNGANKGTESPVTLYSSSGTYTLPTKETVNIRRYRFDFEGWYTQPVGGDPVTSVTYSDLNLTVYAHWTPKEDQQAYIQLDGTKTLVEEIRVRQNGSWVPIKMVRFRQGDKWVPEYEQLLPPTDTSVSTYTVTGTAPYDAESIVVTIGDTDIGTYEI